MINKAEVDVFLELPCFFDDPADVGNLISGSSALSKSSLNIWKFTVHALLKPSLENFEHYFASMWYEYNCAVVWTFFDIAVLGLEWKLTFFSHVAIAEFSKFVGILSAMQETQVLSLGWEDPLEEEIATHSNILAWKIPRTEEPGGLQSIGLQRVRHDWVTNTYIKYTIHVMCLNYPETTPPSPSWSMEKLFSMKPVPGTKKVEDCCFLGLEREFLCGLEVEGTQQNLPASMPKSLVTPEAHSRYQGMRQCNRFMTFMYSISCIVSTSLTLIPVLCPLGPWGTLGNPCPKWKPLNGSIAGNLDLQSSHSDQRTVWTHRNGRGFSPSEA